MDSPTTSDFDYDSEAIENEEKLLDLTNKLLEYVGIVSKKVLSVDELVRVGSSLFVAVFESLFHLRISGIIRSPKTARDYTVNAQLVIDELSQQIQMDLKHITGESIVHGDLQSISNLVNILFRIVGLTHSVSNREDSEFPYDGNIETFIAAPKSMDSISTHDSDFNFNYSSNQDYQPHLEQEAPSLAEEESIMKNPFHERSFKKYQLEHKLEGAAARRARLIKRRTALYAGR